MRLTFFNSRTVTASIVLLALTLIGQISRSVAADTTNEFSKPVIDIGIVVSDTDKSAAFYTNAIGFKEVAGFKITAERASEIGLADQPTTVRVFVLGDGNQATRIKLMSFPTAPGKKADQAKISSTLGIRYLTLYVSDMNVALKRLEKEKVTQLGKNPVNLGGTWITVFQDPDGNFIELLGPRK